MPDCTLSQTNSRGGAADRSAITCRTACFNLDEFETAKDAFERGFALEPSNKSFQTWIRKCKVEIEDELERETEHLAPCKGQALDAAPAPAPAPAPTKPNPQPPVAPQQAVLAVAAATEAPKPKFRHEFYQNTTHVVVTIYVKGATAENSSVEFGPAHVELEVRFAKDDVFALDWSLFGPIDVDESKVSFAPTKIELRLKKKSTLKWEKLEGDGTGTSSILLTPSEPTAKEAKIDLYPSSKGLKNWDKIADEGTAGDKPEGENSLPLFFLRGCFAVFVDTSSR